MQTIGQFDHDHPHVLTHGQERLAQGLLGEFDPLLFGPGLSVAPAHAGQLGQLGDPVHQNGDFIPEVPPDLGQANARVFHGVVQQAGRQHRRRSAQVGQDIGHRQTVVDVPLTGEAALIGVGLLRERMRPQDQVPITGRCGRRKFLEEIVNLHARGSNRV